MPPREYRSAQFGPPLYVRQLEERRVLSVAPSAVIVPPVVLSGLAEGDALSMEPGEAATAEAPHTDGSLQNDEPAPAAADRGADFDDAADSPAESTDDAAPASIASNVAVDPLAAQVSSDGLTLTVASDQTVDEGALLTITDIGQFTDGPLVDDAVSAQVDGSYTFTIDWGDGTTADSGMATIDVPGSEGSPTLGSFDGSHTYADNGVYTVTVTLNRDDVSVSDTFTVTVDNVTPTLEVPEDQTIDEGSPLVLVDIGQFTDPGFNNPLNEEGETSESFTFAIDWGDGTEIDSGPATIDVAGGPGVPTQGSFDGSHTYADNGVYTVTVTLSDDDGGTISKTFTVTVENVTPGLVVPEDQTIDEGSLLSLTDIGVFTDPGFNNPLNEEGETSESFTFAIDWGDGTEIDSGPATIDVPGGPGVPTQGSFDGSHTYADNGVYTVTVTISDDDGGTTSATFQVTVNNVTPTLIVPPDQTIDEGATLTLVDIGVFTDPAFDNPLNEEGETSETFTFAIDWGDGTEIDSGPATIDVPGGPGVLTQGSFDGSHIYADNGVYTVTVTISDDDGGTVSQTFTVTVNNVTPTLVVPEDQTIDEGALLSLVDIGVFTDPGFDNPLNEEGETTESFTFAIDWGDGSEVDSGPPTIDVPGGPGVLTQGSFDGSHIYADNGVYTVTVTISDDDGGTVSQTFTVTVNNVAPTLVVPEDQVVDEGALLSIPDIGAFTDPGFDNPQNPDGATVESFTFSIDWGDGTTVDSGAVTIDVPGGPGVPTQGSFDGSHIYADNGLYTVTVTVMDDDGGTTTATFEVTVNNVAPTLVVPDDQTINEGELLSLPDIGVFTDPGFDNPLNVEGETTETFTFAIDWGDGSEIDSGPGTIDVPGGPGVLTQGSFDGSHTYTTSGVYTVTVTISDDDGGTASATFQVTVTSAVPNVIAAPDQVTNEGSLLSITDIGQFTSGNLQGDFTFSIDWGDGTTGDVGVPTIDVPGSTGVPLAGSFDGSHTYADNGVYLVTVTVIDGERSASAQLQVTVNNVAPTLAVPPNQTVGRGDPLVLPNIGQFLDPGFDNPLNVEGETTEQFTFSINWGDGSETESGPGGIDTPGAPGVLTAGSFDGQHVYANGGIYTVTVTVSDDDGGTATGTFLVYVGPTLTGPGGEQILDEGTPLVIVGIGQYIDPTPLEVRPEGSGGADAPYTFTINWGDGTPLDAGSASVIPGETPEVAFAGSFDGAHVYADNGVYQLTMTITSPDGRVDTAIITVIVNNVAPTLVTVGNQTVGQTQPLLLSDIGQFTDPGFDNLLNIGGETTERFTFAINWGDGTPTQNGPAGIDTPGQPGLLTGGSFDGSHIFFASGTFEVTVTVSDDDGGSASATFTVTVGQVNTQNLMFLPPGGGGRAPGERPAILLAAARPVAQYQTPRTEFLPYRAASVAGAEPRLVLTIVLPTGVEDRTLDQELPWETLEDLRSLFKRLPDGHYRIYEIQPDGIERLVIDVIVRQGIAIDASDDADDSRDLLPAEPAPVEGAPPDGEPANAAPQAVPQDAPPPVDGTEASTTEATRPEDGQAADMRWTDALLVAGPAAVYSASGRRATRIARGLQPDSKRRSSKVARLLRKLR